MREVVSDIDRWREGGEEVALATVVRTWGSAPRRVGAKMAMTLAGGMAGSVSGGCVESAVFEAGTQTLKTGQPQLLHFGVADETAWEVGLACGGTIEVFVEPLDYAHFDNLRAAMDGDVSAATATIVRGPSSILGQKVTIYGEGKHTSTLGEDIEGLVTSSAESALQEGHSQSITLPLPDGEDESAEIFVDVLLPAPTLVAVGGVHIAIALTAIAKTLGYRTIVVDPRRAFGSEARFPHVDRLIQAWPGEAFAEIELTPSTAVAMLTHDPKIDDPALKIALPSPAFYVGALGSRTTQANRRERLADAGLAEDELARLHGPIGLDLGAELPEEIALAVMAEIVAARNERVSRSQPSSMGQLAEGV